MLQKFKDAILECYREADGARRTADTATNPETKSDFLVNMTQNCRRVAAES